MIPTTPGYWWRIGPVPLQEDEGVIEQVVYVAPLVPSVPEELFFWVVGEPGAIFIQELPGIRWAGPIPDADRLMELKEAYEHST